MDLKVCFVGVSHTFPNYSGENTRVLQFANNLIDLGVDVHIIVPDFQITTTPFKDCLCKAVVHKVKIGFKLNKYFYFSSLPYQFSHYIDLQKTERFDIVHANMLWGGPLGLATKSLGAAVIFDPHDWFFCDMFNFPLINSDALETACSKLVDATLVTGNNLKAYLNNRGLAKKQVYVVPNGVSKTILDYPFVKKDVVVEIKKTLGINESEKVILFLGALLHYQGVDIFIRAFKNVLQKIPAKLIIVGDGPEKNNLQDLVGSLNLSNNIVFISNVQWSFLVQLLDISDISIIPFRRNNYTQWIQPIKVFEYFSRGKPVIASNLLGISEIVKDGINGVLVPPENIDSITTATIDLLNDERARKKMGEKGRNLVKEQYQWSDITKSLKCIYEMLLN